MNLKKNWKVFTSKFVGTGPSSYEKGIYQAAVSQRLRNTVLEHSPRDFAKWPKCRLPLDGLSYLIFFAGFDSPRQPRLPHCWGFAITLRHTTVGRTPLDEESARCRNPYLTSHNNQRRHRSMPPRGFEPAIAASLRPRIHAFDRKAIGIGEIWYHWRHIDIIGDIFSEHNQQEATFLKFIHFCKPLYMFQTVFPSIISTYSTYMPDAVCAVLSSWWWTENPSETCRAAYRNK
jgi:hypothetical protein